MEKKINVMNDAKESMEKRIKYFTFLSILIFLVSMLPILSLTIVNRATGDDYGYGSLTHFAWRTTHSFIEVAKAVCQTVRNYYYGWQGTWFSIALFSLQPEVFHNDAYVIVVILMFSLWTGSTIYLFRHILFQSMRMNKWFCCLITVWFLLISIEFIPSPRSSIFWFNGSAHYMVPFAMCQILTVWLLRFSKTYKKTTFIGIFIFMALLGGSNYQAALLALIVSFYVGIAAWFLKKDKRIFLLLFPIVAELIGLGISMKSPGNNIRAGEDFGFSFGKCIYTIGASFGQGLSDIANYKAERPLIFIGLLLLFILFIMVFYFEKATFTFQHPVWLSIMLYCLYSAMQAPAIYADVSVSAGVPNTNYLVFLLTSSGILLVIAEKAAGKLKTKWTDEKGRKKMRLLILSGSLLSLILLYSGKGHIKESTSYISLIYITSGQASDYKEQMDLQTKLMEDSSVSDVIIPQINDFQGPLMHMPVTDNKKAWTNTVASEFYGKNSTVSIDRVQWIELYGEKWGY